MEARELRRHEASTSAGHFAYATIHQHGVEIGATILGAYARTMVLAYAAVAGWTEVDKLLAEIANKRPRLGKCNARLHVVKE